MDVDGMITVLSSRSVFKMCVMGDSFVFVVIDV